MKLISWDDSFSVKVSLFDEHHKKLFSILNTLANDLYHKKPHFHLNKIFDELIAYSKYHFDAEISFLEDKGYPNIKSHKSLHDDFIKKISKLKQDYETDNSFLSIELLQFLTDWLYNHIEHVDKKYAFYLEDKGLLEKSKD
jgi:hemerythrin-like metal-binding protein